jgi:hypothetical protein
MMQIIVRLFEHNTFLFYINPYDTVFSLKEKIEKKIGLNKYMHKLMFRKKEMMNNELLLKYNLNYNNVISIVVLTKRTYL